MAYLASFKNFFLQDIRFLFSKGFFYIVGSELTSKVIGFLTSIIIIKILSKELFGSFSYANTILGFFLLLSGLGVHSAILQFCSEKKQSEDRLPFLKYGLKIGVAFNVLIGAALILFTLNFELPIKGSKEILFFMALIPLITICYEIIGGYLRSDFRNREYSYIRISFALLYFCGALIGGYLFKVLGIVVGRYFAVSISVLLGFRFLLKNSKIIKGVSYPSFRARKDFLKYAVVAALTNSVSQILYLIDVFLIGIIIQNEMIVASYKVATILPFALNLLPVSIIMFVYPYFARNFKDKQKIRIYFVKLQLYLGVINIIISIFFITFAPVIIKILFGSQYSDAVVPFRILFLGYFIAGTFRIPAGNVLASIRKIKINLYNAIVSGLLNILLNILLIPRLESTGAAIATVSVFCFSSLFSTIYLYIHLNKHAKT